MKGRIKKNQTIKTKQKKLKKQKDEKFFKMQVLKESKVKFVSAIGVCLLTSFCICLWFSHSFRSYYLTVRLELLRKPDGCSELRSRVF